MIQSNVKIGLEDRVIRDIRAAKIQQVGCTLISTTSDVNEKSRLTDAWKGCDKSPDMYLGWLRFGL